MVGKKSLNDGILGVVNCGKIGFLGEAVVTVGMVGNPGFAGTVGKFGNVGICGIVGIGGIVGIAGIVGILLIKSPRMSHGPLAGTGWLLVRPSLEF